MSVNWNDYDLNIMDDGLPDDVHDALYQDPAKFWQVHQNWEPFGPESDSDVALDKTTNNNGDDQIPAQAAQAAQDAGETPANTRKRSTPEGNELLEPASKRARVSADNAQQSQQTSQPPKELDPNWVFSAQASEGEQALRSQQAPIEEQVHDGALPANPDTTAEQVTDNNTSDEDAMAVQQEETWLAGDQPPTLEDAVATSYNLYRVDAKASTDYGFWTSYPRFISDTDVADSNNRAEIYGSLVSSEDRLYAEKDSTIETILVREYEAWTFFGDGGLHASVRTNQHDEEDHAISNGIKLATEGPGGPVLPQNGADVSAATKTNSHPSTLADVSSNSAQFGNNPASATSINAPGDAFPQYTGLNTHKLQDAAPPMPAAKNIPPGDFGAYLDSVAKADSTKDVSTRYDDKTFSCGRCAKLYNLDDDFASEYECGPCALKASGMLNDANNQTQASDRRASVSASASQAATSQAMPGYVHHASYAPAFGAGSKKPSFDCRKCDGRCPFDSSKNNGKDCTGCCKKMRKENYDPFRPEHADAWISPAKRRHMVPQQVPFAAMHPALNQQSNLGFPQPRQAPRRTPTALPAPTLKKKHEALAPTTFMRGTTTPQRAQAGHSLAPSGQQGRQSMASPFIQQPSDGAYGQTNSGGSVSMLFSYPVMDPQTASLSTQSYAPGPQMPANTQRQSPRGQISHQRLKPDAGSPTHSASNEAIPGADYANPRTGVNQINSSVGGSIGSTTQRPPVAMPYPPSYTSQGLASGTAQSDKVYRSTTTPNRPGPPPVTTAYDSSLITDVDEAELIILHSNQELQKLQVPNDDWPQVSTADFHAWEKEVFDAFDHEYAAPPEGFDQKHIDYYLNQQTTAARNVKRCISQNIKRAHACAKVLMDRVIKIHRFGAEREHMQLKKGVEQSLRCSDRIAKIVKAIKDNKLVASDILEASFTNIESLARAPDHYLDLKIVNLKSNVRRKIAANEKDDAGSSQTKRKPARPASALSTRRSTPHQELIPHTPAKSGAGSVGPPTRSTASPFAGLPTPSTLGAHNSPPSGNSILQPQASAIKPPSSLSSPLTRLPYNDEQQNAVVTDTGVPAATSADAGLRATMQPTDHPGRLKRSRALEEDIDEHHDSAIPSKRTKLDSFGDANLSTSMRSIAPYSSRRSPTGPTLPGARLINPSPAISSQRVGASVQGYLPHSMHQLAASEHRNSGSQPNTLQPHAPVAYPYLDRPGHDYVTRGAVQDSIELDDQL